MRHLFFPALILLTLFGFAADVHAQVPKVVIDSVRVGFNTGTVSGGAFKTGEWAPVYVSITAGPDRVDRSTGIIVVEANDSDDVQNQYTVDIPPLAAGEAGLVITYVRPGNTGSDINVIIRERPPGTKIFASTKQLNLMFDGYAPANVLYVTTGARPRALKSAFAKKKDATKPEDEQDVGDTGLYRFGYLDSVGQLPTRWFGYAPVDVLVLNTGTQSFIEELIDDKNDIVKRQRDALVEWVRRGGRLVISTGRNQQFAAQLLAKLQIINCAVTGVASRESLPGVSLWAGAKDPFVNKPRPGQEAKIEYAKLEPGKGVEAVAWTKSPPDKGDQPIIVQAPCGLGRVVLVGFDLDQPPFTSWSGQEGFWKKLDYLIGPKGMPVQDERTRQMPSFGWSGDENELGTQLRNSLESFPEIPVISFGWVALFILLYIIVVGPLDYLFLKKVVKRLELTWVTFPAVVLIVSAVAYFTAYYLKGNDLKINKVDLVDIDLHGPQKQVQGTTWFTVFSPRIQHYTVGVAPASPDWVVAPATEKNEYSTVVSWLGRTTNADGRMRRGSAQTLFRRAYDYAPDAAGLVGVPIQVWSTKSFTATWRAPIDAAKPLVTADLTPSKATPNWISGKLTSNLPGELTEVVLFYRGEHYGIERLTPGVPLRVDDLRKSHKGRASDWADVPVGRPSTRQISGNQRYGYNIQSTGALMTPLLFKELAQRSTNLNSGFRHFDETWRVANSVFQAEEIVVCGHFTPQEGPAQNVAEDGISASRLWLGQLPDGRSSAPTLSGTLAQETYVRIFIPVVGGP